MLLKARKPGFDVVEETAPWVITACVTVSDETNSDTHSMWTLSIPIV